MRLWDGSWWLWFDFAKRAGITKLCSSMGFYEYIYKSSVYKTEHTFYDYFQPTTKKPQGSEVSQVQWNWWHHTILSPDSYLHSCMHWIVGYRASSGILQLWFRMVGAILTRLLCCLVYQFHFQKLRAGSSTCLEDLEGRVEKTTNSNTTK